MEQTQIEMDHAKRMDLKQQEIDKIDREYELWLKKEETAIQAQIDKIKAERNIFFAQCNISKMKDDVRLKEANYVWDNEKAAH